MSYNIDRGWAPVPFFKNGTEWHAKKSKSGTQNRPQVHAIARRRRNFHENRKIDPEIIDVVKDVIDAIDDFTRFE